MEAASIKGRVISYERQHGRSNSMRRRANALIRENRSHAQHALIGGSSNARSQRRVVKNDAYYSGKVLRDVIFGIVKRKRTRGMAVIDPCAGKKDLPSWGDCGRRHSAEEGVHK